MNETHQNNSDKNKNATNSTDIGNVFGQVHTGSGNIILGQVKDLETIDIRTISEFQNFLFSLKQSLDKVDQYSLPSQTKQEVQKEIDIVEDYLAKNSDKIRGSVIINRLEKIRSVLIASTQVVVATTTTISAANKLVPIIEKLIKVARDIF